MSKKIFNIENGQKIEYEVIMQFTSKTTAKKYLFYTNNKRNADGKLEIFVSNYIVNNDNYILYPIEDKKEIDMCNQILKDLREKLNS